jgi:membrane protein required for colicin V production
VEGLPVTLFDLGVLAVVGLSALVGLSRGAVAEILALASWIGAAVAAFVAWPYVAPMARQVVVAGETLADALAVAGVFLVALIALKLITGMVTSAIAASALSPIDKLAGFAFGAVRGVFLVCAAYLVASQFVPSERQPVWVNEARLIGPVRSGSAMLAEWIPLPDQGIGPATAGAGAAAGNTDRPPLTFERRPTPER